MDSLREILPDPEQIGLALFLPFVPVVAGFAASLAALYLLIGVDPSGPVGNLVVDYIDLTLPMAGRVLVSGCSTPSSTCVSVPLTGTCELRRWL